MENHILMHGRKCFPGAVNMTKNTRKEGHEQGEKTCLDLLVLQGYSGNAGKS